MYSNSIKARLRILENKEIVIEKQSTNLVVLIWLLIWHILKWPLRFGTVGLIKLKPEEWFIYTYSVYDNYLYFLINDANDLSNKLLETHEKIEAFKERKEREIKAIKANSNPDNITLDRSGWMRIPKSEIPFVGRMKKPDSIYLKILNDKVLRKKQKGRKFADQPEIDLPTRTTTAYTIGGNDDINRVFQANMADEGIDSTMSWRNEEKKNGQDNKGGMPRKRQKNESAEGHEARLKAMDAGTFDPKTWPWDRYKTN